MQMSACPRRSYQMRNIFHNDLSCDIETTERAAFDNVPWFVVGFAWVDREGLIVRYIHMWTEEVQEHEPGTHETFLIDAC